MTKIFKNSKSVLSFVLAFAVLAVSLFTGAVITSEAACSDTDTDTWEENAELAVYSQNSSYGITYKTYNLVDPELEGSGTEADPYIISSAEELVAVTRGHVASKGKYFKVKDGIKAFYMNKYLTANNQNTTAWIDENADFDTVVKTFTGEWVRANSSTFNGNNNFNAAQAKFEGNFDGNGVVIYGLRSENPNGIGAGLFPLVQGNVTIKNVTVKKSYVAAVSAGVIVGNSTGEVVGNKANASEEGAGSLTIENCSVVDAYIKNTAVWGASGGHGIGAIFGKADHMAYPGGSPYYNGQVLVKNCLVDVDANYVVLTSGNNYVCRGGIGGYSTSNKNKYENCIVFGINPYATLTPTDKNHNRYTSYEATYTNVYTDATVENATVGGTKGTHTFAGITKTSLSSIKSENTLDWENTLFLSENGVEFRSSHGEIKLVTTETTHVWICEDCNLKSFGGEEEHNFQLVGSEVKGDGTDVYMCTVCNYTCQHNSQTPGAYEPGDCVTADGTFARCNYCDWYYATNVGVAPGHDLEWVEEKHATCRADGREGYWHCKVCNGNFIGTEEEALMAAMDTSIIDPENDNKLLINAGTHSAINYADGSIIVKSEGNDGHYWLCYTCDGKLLAVETEDLAEDDKLKDHKYDEGVCVDCGWECLDHDFKPTGTVLVIGSCTEDRQEELKCTNCGYAVAELIPAAHKVEKVAQVDPTANLEGTKAHYICTICKEIYSDAEGKNKVTTASLVIPKIVPNEYNNIIVGNGEVINIDTSNKSPSTGDSIVSVLALAAFSGAAFVMIRKFKR